MIGDNIVIVLHRMLMNGDKVGFLIIVCSLIGDNVVIVDHRLPRYWELHRFWYGRRSDRV